MDNPQHSLDAVALRLNELADRCEAATGPDQRLSEEICKALAGPAGNWAWRDVTRSLDAAMTLVPEGFVWGAGSWGNPDTDGPWAWCATKDDSRDNDLDYGKAATPALALCAASLRAKARLQ